MSRKRKSVICPYCKHTFEPIKPNQFHCSLKCRFWDKVEILDPNNCWNWTASKSSNTYGSFQYKNHSIRAHRMAWILAYGPIPNNLYVLHHCDNRLCCNPTHLFLGTQADNIKDCVKKNRNIKGESCGMAKLTEKNILDIRSKLSMGFRSCDLAILYKVCRYNIHLIKYRKRWTHI